MTARANDEAVNIIVDVPIQRQEVTLEWAQLGADGAVAALEAADDLEEEGRNLANLSDSQENALEKSVDIIAQGIKSTTVSDYQK